MNPRLPARPPFAGLAALAACLVSLLAVPPARAREVYVFAAASLKNALDDCVVAYAAQTTDAEIVPVYAASSALARQIEAGAPADLFFSADTDWMAYLDARRLIDSSTRVDLVTNALVLIAPAKSPRSIAIASGFPLAAALEKGRLALADPDFVPAGKYARAALTKLGVWDSVAGKLARAENVRAALAFVARGEAPLGIVYATDAMAEKKVMVAGLFPADSHPPIVYPAARVADRPEPETAEKFLAFLKSPNAAAVFRKHGFTPLAERERRGSP